MKKHLLFALGVAFAAAPLTSCHGDEDGDGNVVSDFSGNVEVMAMPSQLANYTDNLGASGYMLSDGSINVFTFVTGTSQDNAIYNAFFNGTETGTTTDTEEASEDDTYVDVETGKDALGMTDYPKIYEGFYGGFMPTYQAAVGEDAYDIMNPIDGTYKNNKNCLLANPGQVCKAFFTKNLKSPMAHITMKKAIRLNVQANKMYEYLKLAANSPESTEGQNAKAQLDAWGISLLPANTKINCIVYSYVSSFSIKNIKDAFNTIKNAVSQISGGGKEIGRVTLIETDANGQVTTLCDTWQTIEFSEKTYLGEVYLEARTNCTEENSYNGVSATDDLLGNDSMLNYVLVDNITFEGRSLLGIF